MNTMTERRMPSQIRLDEAARLAGVTTNRLTGAWRQAKLVTPWSGVISTTDLVRAVVAAHLQQIFGEQSDPELDTRGARTPEGEPASPSAAPAARDTTPEEAHEVMTKGEDTTERAAQSAGGPR